MLLVEAIHSGAVPNLTGLDLERTDLGPDVRQALETEGRKRSMQIQF